MRSFTFTSFFAIMAIMLGVSYPANASIQIQPGDIVRISDGPGNNGGRFDAYETSNFSSTNQINDLWYTFCVQVTETITLPGNYQVASLSNNSVLSGSTLNGAANLAATIYAQYLDGTLMKNATTQMVAADRNDAVFNNSVQLAIWSGVYGLARTDSFIASHIGTFDATMVDYWLTGGGVVFNPNTGVKIMNLVNSSGNNVQDLLVRNTGGGTGEVPEAATLVVWGLLASCAALVSSKRHR